jgi:hypothetical protein
MVQTKFTTRRKTQISFQHLNGDAQVKLIIPGHLLFSVLCGTGPPRNNSAGEPLQVSNKNLRRKIEF